MTSLTVRTGEDGRAWFFAAFGVLFGILLVVLIIQVVAKRSASFKTFAEKISGRPSPRTTFVPHWFTMTAILLAIIIVVLLLLINALK